MKPSAAAAIEREDANALSGVAVDRAQAGLDDRKACDYAVSDRDANELFGTVLLPVDFRRKLLQRYHKAHGTAALIELFAQFIGMANSVIVNNREMIELLGIIEGGDHPYTAEKYNLPTLFGALQGVMLANSVDQKATCSGCAYRLGTPANQSPSTTFDADWCRKSDDIDFHCHERLDDAGKPTRLCVGHAVQTKDRRGVRRP